jgi:polysaccharide biosynthesis/export protein VpsN
VAKAVAISGGFKERASQSKMFVIRESDPKKAKERVELGSAIFPGDVLTIEESFF